MTSMGKSKACAEGIIIKITAQSKLYNYGNIVTVERFKYII